MEVPCNTLVRENLNNTKIGGVFINYLNSLALKVLDIQFFYECLNFEINIGGKVCNFLCLCRSPSQTRETSEERLNFRAVLQKIQTKSQKVLMTNFYFSISTLGSLSSPPPPFQAR